jgi:hypothetical protein
MELIKTLEKVKSYLLQGAYQGAEHVLDGAIVEALALIDENAELKQQITAYDIAFDNMTAERKQLLEQDPEWVRNLRVCAAKGDAHSNAYFTIKPSEVIYLIDRAVPDQQSPISETGICVKCNSEMGTLRDCDICGGNTVAQPSPAVAVHDNGLGRLWCDTQKENELAECGDVDRLSSAVIQLYGDISVLKENLGIDEGGLTLINKINENLKP